MEQYLEKLLQLKWFYQMLNLSESEHFDTIKIFKIKLE